MDLEAPETANKVMGEMIAALQAEKEQEGVQAEIKEAGIEVKVQDGDVQINIQTAERAEGIFRVAGRLSHP